MTFIIRICITNIHCIDFTHLDQYIFFFYFQGYNNYRKFLLIEEAILRNLVRFSSKYIKTIIFPSEKTLNVKMSHTCISLLIRKLTLVFGTLTQILENLFMLTFINYFKDYII